MSNADIALAAMHAFVESSMPYRPLCFGTVLILDGRHHAAVSALGATAQSKWVTYEKLGYNSDSDIEDSS